MGHQSRTRGAAIRTRRRTPPRIGTGAETRVIGEPAAGAHLRVPGPIHGREARGQGGEGLGGRSLRVLVVDVDFGHGETGHGDHARRVAEVEAAAEFARPVVHVEEAPDDPAANFFLDALETGAPAQEFFESEAFGVADDVVVGENHQTGSEVDAAVLVGRYEDFLIEEIQPLPLLSDLSHVNRANSLREFIQVNAVDHSARRIRPPSLDTACFQDTPNRVLAFVDAHVENTREFLYSVRRGHVDKLKEKLTRNSPGNASLEMNPVPSRSRLAHASLNLLISCLLIEKLLR